MTDYSLTADESAEVRLTAFSLVFVRTGGRVLGGIGRYWGSWQSIDNSSMKQYQSIFRKKDILLTHATSYQHIPTNNTLPQSFGFWRAAAHNNISPRS
jgi:hypothetical protein